MTTILWAFRSLLITAIFRIRSSNQRRIRGILCALHRQPRSSRHSPTSSPVFRFRGCGFSPICRNVVCFQNPRQFVPFFIMIVLVTFMFHEIYTALQDRICYVLVIVKCLLFPRKYDSQFLLLKRREVAAHGFGKLASISQVLSARFSISRLASITQTTRGGSTFSPLICTVLLICYRPVSQTKLMVWQN